MTSLGDRSWVETRLNQEKFNETFIEKILCIWDKCPNERDMILKYVQDFSRLEYISQQELYNWLTWNVIDKYSVMLKKEGF